MEPSTMARYLEELNRVLAGNEDEDDVPSPGFRFNPRVIEGNEDEDDVPIPGFRFNPTDEELVAFYLRRKVEKRPISVELIRQIDIYKYDPWDLPKSSNVAEKEWYFFCKRGRKYKNSIRPNRVTGSGFWKATGIDKPIYSASGEGDDCIGLKKSLAYYRGSAGKGIKTDWMMHEYRLPGDHHKSIKHIDANGIAQEDEIWTICRIFRHNVSHRKCVRDWKDLCANKRSMNPSDHTSFKTCSFEYDPSRPSHNNFDAVTWPIVANQEFIQPAVSSFGMSITMPNAATTHDDCRITVKATYKDDMIKFPLLISSTLMDLAEEVAKRINLPVGSFKIKYVDEDDDCAVIACDADLTNSINAFRALGRTTIKMSVHELEICIPEYVQF